MNILKKILKGNTNNNYSYFNGEFMDIKITIEKLLKYARVHLDLNEIDEVYFRNVLLNKLKVDSPYIGNLDLDYINNLIVPDTILDEVRLYLVSKEEKDVELKLIEIMGLLSPLPSSVVNKVYELEEKGKGLGLDYLYNLSIKNNYIQKTAIDKNIYFKQEYDNNYLEITINMSKPEKNNKDIAKLLEKTINVNYPKCALCKENLGYFGRNNHPGRSNIRIVPFKLYNENWFLQYSPYAYYYKHAIVINETHSNMSINDTTFSKLLEFVDKFPTFFIGSNADLPIVGGSILNHEHYQGGGYLLPVFYSKDRKVYLKNEKVKISVVDWYNTTIRIESKYYDEVVRYSQKIFNYWKQYDNESVDIISKTDTVRHSTVTPIARKIGDIYSMNLILRNNRCNDKHPDGIFHAHRKYHNIKQEGIGLIEAMGLFILPARLKRQMSYVKEILISNDDLQSYYEKYDDLFIHKDMINTLIDSFGRNLSENQAENAIKEYIANTCKNILLNTAVFKNDQKGQAALDEFMEVINL